MLKSLLDHACRILKILMHLTLGLPFCSKWIQRIFQQNSQGKTIPKCSVKTRKIENAQSTMHVHVHKYTNMLLIFRGTFGIVRTYLTHIHTFNWRSRVSPGAEGVRFVFLWDRESLQQRAVVECYEYADSVAIENRTQYLSIDYLIINNRG